MTPLVEPPITFRFPFPHQLSPDHETAGANSVRWARETGLATGEFAVNRLRQWNWGRLTGHCVPTARGADLDLIAQWMTFGFLYDDQFNGTLGARPDLALRVTEGMIATLYGAPGTIRHAAQRALADLLGRLAATRSQSWLARFRDHMRDYFIGVLHQATYRLDFHALSHHDALALRRANIAMHALVDLIEVAERVEVPPALVATTQLREMRRILVDIVIYENDVFSLPKDRNQPEVNVVLALSREHQLSEQEALTEVETIIAAEVARFQHAQSQLPALCRALGLNEHDQACLDRYVHCLELMIHGCVYSHAECVRYAAETAHTAPLDGTGYLEDLHLAAGVDPHSDVFATTNQPPGRMTPMGEKLPTEVRSLFQAPVFVIVTTINPDGAPQSSVVWAKVDGDDVVMSTIRGRLKCRNMERDPRITLLAYDPEDPYVYAELRGTVTLTEAGGDELIDELCRAYDGKPWVVRPAETRVVVRFTPTKIVHHIAGQSKKKS